MLLIYDVKRTTKIDGMGPFNRVLYNIVLHRYTEVKVRSVVIP